MEFPDTPHRCLIAQPSRIPRTVTTSPTETTPSPRGTAFQQQVWRRLCDIPFGVTASYADIAARLDNPRAVRAVGAANGRNPLAIVVPCHRVIGRDGSLTGYAGGLARKRWLLAHEASRRDFGP